MDDRITLNLNNDSGTIKEKDKKKAKKNASHGLAEKKWLVFLIVGVISLFGGIGCLLFVLLNSPEKATKTLFPDFKSKEQQSYTYSSLTGEQLDDPALKNTPTYCIQTPNGTDGARPQAGLNNAGVVFEAIAEAGITRFAAIYQNPKSAIIGPIRSLRIYYLEWDTPFDCTIVHAGGADDALQAVAAGGYKDLSEDYTYMYRGTYGSRLWNNLFTTSAYLQKFSNDHGYSSSDIRGFSRLTPEESSKNRINSLVTEKLIITEPATANTSELAAKASTIKLRFGGYPAYNVDYNYNIDSNTYLRSYENGVPHEVYACPSEDLGERNPEDVCSLTQMNPSVVAVMMVDERRASDNYHEDISAIGSGDAYIFQNGIAITGTWNKSSREEQIKFTDKDGNEIKLAPGQTFVSAVPTYGSVEY